MDSSGPADQTLEKSTLEQTTATGEAHTVLADKYKLTERIGEGGMGSVWVAQQSTPVKRKVAVKLIKLGMDSRQVLARFDAERQALAMMDHPNIARVLDGGLAPDGRPFFVMELVKGVPITQFCDTRKLTPRQRLELLIPVCQAIQHAHQKGIIHRDIKPSNVLIALYDDQPVPKVIDFGVAKATGGALTTHTLETGFADVVGTPQYMSPEQATLNNLDIDTRSDVYALGVLLYELLTGTPPFSKQELEKHGLLEILRFVRESETQRPSTRVSTAGTLAALSAQRSTDPRALTGLLRNELDWIVMKALEKERSRRYQTPAALAADISRYLRGDPVEAHPPSAAYRIRKFVRRHRSQVVAATLLFVALIAGITGTTIGLVRARQSAASEKLARDNAERATAAETVAREEAQKRLVQVEKGLDLIGGILKGINPRSDTPMVLQLRVNAERAADQLKSGALGDPLAEARLQSIMGVTLGEMGNVNRSVQLLEQAAATFEKEYGLSHDHTLATLHSLAFSYRQAGDLPRAIELAQRVRDLQVAKHGDDHPDTLAILENLGLMYSTMGNWPQAIELLKRVSDTHNARFGPTHIKTLRSMGNLAGAYRPASQVSQAIEIYEQVLAGLTKSLGPHHVDTLTTMDHLASSYRDAGQYVKAIELHETLRARQVKQLGPDNQRTQKAGNNLAVAYLSAGRIDDAIKLFEQVRDGLARTLGPTHYETWTTASNLGHAYAEAGRTDEGIKLMEQAAAGLLAKLGEDHPRVLSNRVNLAAAYRSQGDVTRSIDILETVYKSQQSRLGPDHHLTLATMNNLAGAYQDAGNLDKALELREEAIKRHTAALGADHPNTLALLANHAFTCELAGRTTQALDCYAQAMRGMEKHGFTQQHVATYVASASYAYEKAGNFDQARSWRQAWLDTAKRTRGENSTDYASALAGMGFHYLQQEQWQQAEPLLRQSLEIWKACDPENWQAFRTQSVLGEALSGQKKYTEAQPLLLEGYQGLRQREKKIPQSGRTRNISQAIDRLISHYKSTRDAEEVKKWESEKASLLHDSHSRRQPGDKLQG